MSASCCAGTQSRRGPFFARRSLSTSFENRPLRSSWTIHLILAATVAVYLGVSLPAQATVSSVSVHAPKLSASSPTNVTSPVHFEVTAESDTAITGYVIYVDN